MDAFPSSEEEIVASAELFIHHIFIVIPYNDEKIAIFFHPSLFQGFQCLFAAIAMVPYQGGLEIRGQRARATEVIPDGIHSIYLQGGALSIKVQSWSLASRRIAGASRP
jgi:hypothetical protein